MRRTLVMRLGSNGVFGHSSNGVPVQATGSLQSTVVNSREIPIPFEKVQGLKRVSYGTKEQEQN